VTVLAQGRFGSLLLDGVQALSLCPNNLPGHSSYGLIRHSDIVISPPSLDHLIGTAKQWRGYRDAECLSHVEIDKPARTWLVPGQVSRMASLL
jgi:hypothetical protein